MPPGVTQQQAVLIRMRPTGPWRYGPGDGANDRVDTVYRSDRLYSAVTVSMQQLDYLEEWLDATARAATPALAFSSLYPYQGDTLFATPPASIWPPPMSQLTAPNPAFLNKIRWNAVQLVPLSVIETLLSGRSVPAEQWTADPATGCLLRRDRPGSTPFRVTVRTGAAVDRVTRGAIEVSSAACVEFEPDAGLWTVARYRDAAAASTWQDRLQACFRLLADSGFGGRRTHGWGKTETPEFKRGTWPGLILPKLSRGAEEAGDSPEASLFWLLSLYSPAAADTIDWRGGDYRLTLRGGRVESIGATGLLKKNARMIAEGSVLAARQEPTGTAVDVAPDNFTHPVYRSGFALALKLPVAKAASDFAPVESPSDEEALEARPCEQEEGEAATSQDEPGRLEDEPEHAQDEVNQAEEQKLSAGQVSTEEQLPTAVQLAALEQVPGTSPVEDVGKQELTEVESEPGEGAASGEPSTTTTEATAETGEERPADEL